MAPLTLSGGSMSSEQWVTQCSQSWLNSGITLRSFLKNTNAWILPPQRVWFIIGLGCSMAQGFFFKLIGNSNLQPWLRTNVKLSDSIWIYCFCKSFSLISFSFPALPEFPMGLSPEPPQTNIVSLSCSTVHGPNALFCWSLMQDELKQPPFSHYRTSQHTHIYTNSVFPDLVH